jgi:hypothetical protein
MGGGSTRREQAKPKSKRWPRILFLIVLGLIALAVFNNDRPTNIMHSGAWDVYVSGKGGTKECYARTTPSAGLNVASAYVKITRNRSKEMSNDVWINIGLPLN